MKYCIINTRINVIMIGEIYLMVYIKNHMTSLMKGVAK